MLISIQERQTIALFAILFILIGTVAPIVYTQVAPESQFVEVHSFTVEDTHVQAEEHNIHLDRTVYRPAEADITVEMILLRDDDVIVEEDSFEIDAYYQEGRKKLIIPRKIKDSTSIEVGTYQYVDTVTLSYHNGMVERTFVHRSDTFTVYENKSNVTDN